jgi:hypothetical protein
MMMDKADLEIKAASIVTLGAPIDIQYPYSLAIVPTGNKIWARVTRSTYSDKQATFRNGTGQRYTVNGILTIEILFPQSSPEFAEKCRTVADAIKDGFRASHTGSIWYRDCVVREMPRDGSFNRLMVVADFQHDEVK